MRTAVPAHDVLHLHQRIEHRLGPGRATADVDIDGQDAIDALLENCIRQYRSKGMTYRETRNRMLSVIDDMERKSREAEEEKRDYGIS